MKFKKITIFVLTIIFITYNCIFNYSLGEDNTVIQADTDEQKMNLDDNFWNSEELGIGVFFSNKIEGKEDGTINKTVDNNLGLYITNDGKNFTYIGETGIQGRDPNIMYKNGVFYLATTKGGSTTGKIVFNIFKSTDLINWTTILENEGNYTYPYRYEPEIVPNNKYGMGAITWSPKWFTDGDKTYILVSTARFTEDGGSLYYIKGDTKTLGKNGFNSDEYLNLDINPDLGVLIKESVVLDEQGAPTYDENNNLITKKEFMLDKDGKVIQILCPWYEPNYQIFDTYIAEVNIGEEEAQKDINYQNLTFGEFKKINFKGFKEKNSDNSENLYYKKHSMLGGYLVKNENNNTYKYTMYTKTDPYGTVQRWIAETLDGEWIQADDRYYVSENPETNSEDIVCSSTENIVNHIDRVSDSIIVNTDDTKAFKKHYEGSFLSSFEGNTLFYSDHYIINDTSEVGDKSDFEKYVDNVRNVSGIYYSTLDKNSEDQSGNEITDLGITEDHIRYSNFVKIDTFNTNMRPSAATNNELRNGCVFKVNEEEKDAFKNILKKASEFNVSIVKSIEESTDKKVTVVLKSNRALRERDENGNYEQWYDEGWRYASEMKNDIDVDLNFRKIYNSFSKSTPYSIDEVYIYKTFDKNANETIKLTDMTENEKSINVSVDNIVTNNVTGIEVTAPNKTSYVKGTELNLAGGKITVTYEDGSTKEITMTDTGVAVEGYDKTKLGSQTITVTYAGKTATFEVTVTNNVTGIEVTAPNKTSYVKETELDLAGGKITVTYEDGSTKEIAMTDTGVAVEGYDKTKLGSQTITVTYAGKTATFEVTVTNNVTEIEVTVPNKTSYVKGTELDLAGGKITVTYEDGSTKEIAMTATGVAVEGYDKTKLGSQTITVTYAGKTATFEVTVTNNVTGIEVTVPNKTSYVKGTELDLAGGKITVTYEDGSTKEIAMTATGVIVEGYDKTKLGSQTITVTYAGQKAQFEIEVEEIKSYKDNTISKEKLPQTGSINIVWIIVLIFIMGAISFGIFLKIKDKNI